ncbi:translocon-associated protein subunit alpha isoform X1 [Alosa sapidissima]|uniref:translocon-associated protein subunit alpha isoform X1 n=1 Tax=Alosa sapidissima TaxID=34773 RepID=UPI001C089BD4|nr:translocon-associated protein subunit alpha isoform X1 [Alosa sapidissima]
MMKLLPRLLLLLLLAFPTTILLKGPLVAAQDATEDEEAADEDLGDDVIAEDDDEAEVEDDENTELTEEKDEEEEEEALTGEVKASPHADTTILFVKGDDFPANNIVKFLMGFTNKGAENFVVESLDASFRYPQDFQFYIQNFTALQLGIVVPPLRQATFEYSFIPAEPMGGRPFGLVINLNYKDSNGNVFQDAVFNQTVTVTEREDGLDGETIFMYVFLGGLGLLVVVGLHQLLESRKGRQDRSMKRKLAKAAVFLQMMEVDMRHRTCRLLVRSVTAGWTWSHASAGAILRLTCIRARTWYKMALDGFRGQALVKQCANLHFTWYFFLDDISLILVVKRSS